MELIDVVKFARSDGTEVIAAARRRLTDDDILLDRDVAMFARKCQGRRVVEIAREYGLDRRYVHRRLAKIPPKAQDYIRRRVSENTQDGITIMPEESVEGAKGIIRKERRRGSADRR